MDILVALLAVILILIALIAILNSLTFPRLALPQSSFSHFPFVSVLIPARDESAIIVETIQAWLAQTYPAFELLILDDDSTDGTTNLARQSAGGDPRLRLLDGAPLPEGWKGKNWACHQLAQVARGDILLFTDADVRWEPQALTALVTEMTGARADLLTVWPTQITCTWTERLVVPLVGFVVNAYLPVLAVHNIPWPVFSAAIGQCLAFSRDAYKGIGGHAAVRDRLVEDVAFAHSIKRKHLRLRTADSAGLISARMYKNWGEVRDGFAKNILAGHANSLAFLLFSTLFHWLLFLFPWFWLFIKPGQALILCGLGILARALTAAVTRQRPGDALFLPVSVLLMTIIVGRAVQWHFGSGPRWKGRSYKR